MYKRDSAPVLESPIVRGSRVLFSRYARFFYLAVFLLAVYFLTLSPYFLVKKVSVTTDGTAPEAVAEVLKQLRSERIFFIPQNHLLLLNPRSFFKSLQQEIPEVKKITYFKRHWPDWLEIGIEQREARYVWQSGENYYFVDQDGIPFTKFTDYLPQVFTQSLIVDRSAKEVKLGENLDIQKHLAFIENIKTEWAKKISQTEIAAYTIPSALSSDVFVKTKIGFEVYLDLERSAADQLESLRLLLTQEIRPETYSGLSYIDVRLANVAYYCYKDAPCAKAAEPIESNP